ncbi:polysaccharide biosynthesis tyrosine autokinase [Pedobacter sp. HMF7647]|uniref:non-specific protein-tyrosine kinase n=1 Tax=Hufsiella arboris TaxID=2695275 RepID=A0A7K1YDH0_9SPHI|nr:tyrosine-protein kinase [Hufsiella arboris]MXV52129.1 polysaccharide biosynthesis tyrosine autokinase [Hufsiella arboris]
MNNLPNDSFFFQHEEPQNEFNFKELISKYLAYWKWFVISILLALVLAFVYLKLQTPLYNVQSSILIKDQDKGVGEDDLMKELDIFSSNKIVDNEIVILKSYTLMEKVVNNLNLQASYFSKEGLTKTELYKNSPVYVHILKDNGETYKKPLQIKIVDRQTVELNDAKVPLNTPVKTSFGTFRIELSGKSPDVKEVEAVLRKTEWVVENYIHNLTVETSSKMSSVLLLNLQDAVPARGVDILNKLVDAYNNAGLADKNKVAANTLVFVDERLKLISQELTSVEKNVQNFKSSEGITDISTESQLFLQNVQQNDQQLSQVKIQQGVLNSIERYVSSTGDNSGTVPATLGVSDPTLLSLIETLTKLQTQRQSTIRIIKPDNPIVQSLDDQIRSIKANIYDNIQTLKKNIEITRDQLETQNRGIESTIRTIPVKERTLVDISRQQAIKNDLYTYLLKKREETALSYASAVYDSRTVDKARSSVLPVKPVKKNIFLLFAVVGLIVPFGVVYGRDLMNDRVRNRREIEKFTSAPIIGEIAETDNKEALVVSKLGRTAIAEQIRALRTNLAFLSPGKGIQSILFTSSMSGEGKSFVSLNLGASLAMTGKRTVILEMDLRKPKLHVALKMPNIKGISNFLIGQETIDNVITAVPEQENFYIITSGPIPPNPAELLISPKLKELFEDLKSRFDYIIIDAPPVGVVTDSQIIEDFADTTLYIIRHDYTPRERLQFVDLIHKQKKFKNLNLVFNGIKQGSKYGYGYHHDYGYYEQ